MLNLKIKNKSKFFREFDRTYNEVSDSTTFRFAQQKMEGFETRLYYEYEYTKSCGGFTCFLTLTYNEKALPRQLGMPCFDYEDIRYFTHGPFYRDIKSKGWNFKYFISCELGEGKGSRLDGNPHYHALLFFVPNRKDPDTLVPNMVEHLVKIRWQGFDDRHQFRRFEDSRFGIVRPGKFGSCVNSFRALQYCAKYVTKSRSMRELEARYREHLEKDYFPSTTDYFRFCSMFCQGLDAIQQPWLDFGQTFLQWFDSDRAKDFRDWYFADVAEDIDHRMRQFRNRYGDKVRLSNGIGEDACNKILWSDHSPILMVPDGKKGFKSRTLPLYIFRKKYCYVDKSNPEKYPRYVLNELGLALKMDQFSVLVNKRYNDAIKARDVFMSRPYDFPFDDNPFDVEPDAYMRYADYKTVYQYRQYDPKTLHLSDDLDPFADFCRFLKPPGNEDWNPSHHILDDQGLPAIRLEYISHPHFAPYSLFFSAVDIVLDKLEFEDDKKNMEYFQEKERLKKLYNNLHYIGTAYTSVIRPYSTPDLINLHYDSRLSNGQLQEPGNS